MALQHGMSLAFGTGGECTVATTSQVLSVPYLFRHLLAGFGVLTMLQQSIQDLIQAKWPLHQKGYVFVELNGTKLQVSASGKHCVCGSRNKCF